MELGCQVLLGHFGPAYLLQVSKNDDEECCFLKWFGFIGILGIKKWYEDKEWRLKKKRLRKPDKKI